MTFYFLVCSLTYFMECSWDQNPSATCLKHPPGLIVHNWYLVLRVTSEAIAYPLMTHLRKISLAYWREPHAKYVVKVADADIQPSCCFITLQDVTYESNKKIQFVSYGIFLTIPHWLIIINLLFSRWLLKCSLIIIFWIFLVIFISWVSL